MADFSAYASLRPQLSDSASPGRHQPTSLREALLFEKWSRTLRVRLMADFSALSSQAFFQVLEDLFPEGAVVFLFVIAHSFCAVLLCF